MLTLKDIRQYISSLGIAEDRNVYIGKLDNKQQHAIGVYPRNASGGANIAAGGLDATLHDVRHISLLVHWDKSASDTEAAAWKLFEQLREANRANMGGTVVDYIQLMVPEPVSVNTDDKGVYEYVIWIDLHYERNR